MSEQKQSRTKFVDLIIFLIVIGIIALVAYPLYNNHIVSTRRAEAKIALYNLVGAMKKHYSIHRTFKTATINQGKDTDVLKYSVTPDSFYELSIASQTETDFVIQATPMGDQLEDDIQCGTLSITRFGEKSITGTSPLHKCW